MGTELSFTVSESMTSGRLRYFVNFNRTPTTAEKTVLDSVSGVNTSRGGTRMQSISSFVGGSGGGANWAGSASIHSDYALGQFKKRMLNQFQSTWNTVKAQIAANAAVASAKAAAAAKTAATSYAPTVVASFNGN